MTWVDDKYAALNEQVWEKLDTAAAAGVTEVRISRTWRSFGDYKSPELYTATIRVFGEAVKAGILLHPSRGVYLIAQNVK